MKSKPERSEGFDVIIRSELKSASQTTPKQPGHYSHYDTKVAYSRYFHWKLRLIALAETDVAAILFLETYWAYPYVTHGLCLFPMSCRTLCLVWSVNCALYAKLWRHNDLIYARHLIMTMTLESTTFHCSKRYVKIVSGSLATLYTRVLIMQR